MPLTPWPIDTSHQHSSMPGPLGFFSATPVNQPGAYTAGYAVTNRALNSYTAAPMSSAFTGGLLDLLQAARLADLNTVRANVENLRSLAESATQNHNALVADLKTLGLIG